MSTSTERAGRNGSGKVDRLRTRPDGTARLEGSLDDRPPPDRPEPPPRSCEADPPSATAQRSRTQGPRDPWFDNAKFLLVTLVVVGHSLDPAARDLVEDRPTTGSTSGTYRRSSWSPDTSPAASRTRRRDLRRLATTVVVPYVVFEGLFALFRVDRRR